MLALAVVTAIFGVSFLISIQRPRAALYTAVFLAPWQGLDCDVGLRMTAYLAVLAPLFIATLLRIPMRSGLALLRTRTSALFLAFIAYAIIWSLIQVPFLPQADVSGGALRSPVLRALTQIPMFLLTVSPALVVPWVLRDPSQVTTVWRVYIWSAGVLAAVGWVQIVTWYLTGWNPMPIGLVNSLLGGMGEGTREGSYELGGNLIYRMNSLAGEPKDLGAALVVAMLIIQSRWQSGGSWRARSGLLWLFLAVSTFATLSTTAIYLWLIGSLVLPLLRIRWGMRGYHGWQGSFRVGAFILGLVLAGAIAVGNYDRQSVEGAFLTASLYERTLGREMLVEDFDDAILQHFAAEPVRALVGVGIGNAHLYADRYLAPDVATYAGGTSFVAKSGYLRTISELGIIGLLMWSAWVWRQTVDARKAIQRPVRQRHDQLFLIAPIAGMMMALLFLGSAIVAPQLYLALGTCAALANIGQICLARVHPASKIA